jgi:hypothetical protein
MILALPFSRYLSPPFKRCLLLLASLCLMSTFFFPSYRALNDCPPHEVCFQLFFLCAMSFACLCPVLPPSSIGLCTRLFPSHILSSRVAVSPGSDIFPSLSHHLVQASPRLAPISTTNRRHYVTQIEVWYTSFKPPWLSRVRHDCSPVVNAEMRPGNGPASPVIARRRAEMMTNACAVVFPPPPPPLHIAFRSNQLKRAKKGHLYMILSCCATCFLFTSFLFQYEMKVKRQR